MKRKGDDFGVSVRLALHQTVVDSGQYEASAETSLEGLKLVCSRTVGEPLIQTSVWDAATERRRFPARTDAPIIVF